MERGYAQVLRANLRHMHCTTFVEEKWSVGSEVMMA